MMNVYRISMIVLGFAIFIPELVFLWKLRTGKDPLNYMIGLAQRLRSVALVAMGIRLVTLYYRNPNAGATTPTSDHVISIALAALAASAGILSLFVYFRIRRIPANRAERRRLERRKVRR